MSENTHEVAVPKTAGFKDYTSVFAGAFAEAGDAIKFSGEDYLGDVIEELSDQDDERPEPQASVPKHQHTTPDKKFKFRKRLWHEAPEIELEIEGYDELQKEQYPVSEKVRLDQVRPHIPFIIKTTCSPTPRHPSPGDEEWKAGL